MMLNKITRMMRSRKGQMTIAWILIAVVGLAVALYFIMRKRRDGFANISYRQRIKDATSPSGWRCPKGWRDTGEDWNSGDWGANSATSDKPCAYMRYKTVGEDGKCPAGYVKVDRPPKGADAKYVCRHARKGDKESKDLKVNILKPVGKDCTRDNQCIDGVCSGWKCQPKWSVDDWQFCRTNRWCKSQKCNGDNKCQPRPGGGSPAPAPPPSAAAPAPAPSSNNNDISTDVIG